MQNDMLKNTIAPWQEKGRWYHGTVDVPNNSFITDKTDKYIKDNFTLYTSGANLYLNPNDTKFICLTSIIKVSKDFTRGTTTAIGGYYITGTGKLMCLASPTGSTGTCEFWVFVFEY